MFQSEKRGVRDNIIYYALSENVCCQFHYNTDFAGVYEFVRGTRKYKHPRDNSVTI